MSRNREALLKDLVGELETAMKTDSPADLRETNLPLLQVCAEAVAGSRPIDEALEELVSDALNRVDMPDRSAIAHLFLGTSRWEPLAHRGTAAASELGVTYDALRRRNKNSTRRFDALLMQLASAIADASSLEHLLFAVEGYEPAPNPAEDTVDRASVFLSYSRDDDNHEGGLISALRESLMSEFRFQTGQELFVFQDTANIELGENWRRRLENEIDTTKFLLVILTPSYLRSPRCRDELRRFLQREEELGRDDLVLTVYYASIPEDAGDDLASVLLDRQYVDWRGLRFHTFDDVPVRRAVATLASSIASALARTASPARRPIRETLVEEPGLLERLVAMELAMPRLVRGILSLTSEQEGVTEEIGQAAQESERLNQMGRGSTARLVVARRLLSHLEPCADRMEEHAQAIRADLEAIEMGVNAMAQEVPSSNEEGIDEAINKMVGSIRQAQSAGGEARISVEAMGESYAGVARTVSTLRPVLERLFASASVISTCVDRFGDWVTVLDEALSARRR